MVPVKSVTKINIEVQHGTQLINLCTISLECTSLRSGLLVPYAYAKEAYKLPHNTDISSRGHPFSRLQGSQ